ncbi:MAG: hypothetical protein Fur0037_26630 [Planctomycetota bacterium]
MVFAGMPSAPSYGSWPVRIPLECRAVTNTGLVFAASWELQRASEVEPVFLEPRPDVRVKDVRFEVRDPNGRSMPMDVLVGGSGSKTSLYAPGSLLLPFGDYAVTALHAPRWISESFTRTSFRVDETSPPAGLVGIVITEPLCLLRIQPRLTGRSLGVAHIVFRDLTAMRSYGMMNLEPSKGPWEMWIPMGKIQIQVQSAAYRPLTRELQVKTPELEVELPIEPKESR